MNGSRSKGNHKQGNHRTSEGERSGTWPSLEGEEGSASVDEEDELKEMKGNSLNGAKSFDRPRTGQNLAESSLPTGPLFSDQDQVQDIPYSSLDLIKKKRGKKVVHPEQIG